jgi:hypothetical protein
MQQRSVIPFEVAQQFSDMPLKTQDACHVAVSVQRAAGQVETAE